MPRWDVIFDLLSSEYGWSTEYIFGLTTREISWRMTAINKRLSDDIEIQASLHGLKFKGDKSVKKEEEIPLNKTQEKNLEAIINSRLSKGKK